MKNSITVLLGMLSVATFLHAQSISSYSIITTGSVLKGGANGKIVLTQPMYEKLAVEQSAALFVHPNLHNLEYRA